MPSWLGFPLCPSALQIDKGTGTCSANSQNITITILHSFKFKCSVPESVHGQESPSRDAEFGGGLVGLTWSHTV